MVYPPPQGVNGTKSILNAVNGVATSISSILTSIASLSALSSSSLAGKTQILQKTITSAANAGDVTVATVTDKECSVKGINVRANGVTTANLTNIGVYAGAGKVNTLVDSVTGARANIDAADKQVGNAPLGGVVLPAGSTVVITLTGTGAAAVNLTVTIEYTACEDGGYLS